jgi:hypothetical protein
VAPNLLSANYWAVFSATASLTSARSAKSGDT